MHIDHNQKSLSLDEFSQLANLDPRRVQQLAKEGVINKKCQGEYELAEITSYIRYLQKLVQKRKIEPEQEEGENHLNPEQEKARADKERADKLALENHVRRGELLEAEEIENLWADIALAIKSKLLGLSSKIASYIPNVTLRNQIKAKIDKEVRQILQELSKNAVVNDVSTEHSES